jgi:putative sigma-54 modulation protein
VDIQIKAHNLKLTDGIREYVERRVSKLDRLNERITEAKFELREEPHHSNPAHRVRAQFTIVTKRAVLRAEEQAAEVHTAIDLVTDKMARQIRRFHDRKVRGSRRDAVNLGLLAADLVEEQVATEPDEESDGVVVRTKRFPVQPMDTAEAIEQIELLGHDFFVFYNLESSQMNVLYRRREGDYGLLVPELA